MAEAYSSPPYRKNFTDLVPNSNPRVFVAALIPGSAQRYVFPEGRSFGETMSSASGFLTATTGSYELSSDSLVIIYLIL